MSPIYSFTIEQRLICFRVLAFPQGDGGTGNIACGEDAARLQGEL